MKKSLLSRTAWIALFVGVISAFSAGSILGGEAIPNWPAPAAWTPSRAVGLHTLTDVTSPLPFIGITPCRVADTRGNGFTGAYGPPALAANANRNFTITGQCGVPSGAAAVSFNFAALNVGSAGDLRVFPAGASLPLVSTMNYNGNTPNIANAAIVPLGTGGAITVRADAVSVDLIIDVNGYYARAAANQNNTFEVDTLAPWAITGKTGSSNALATGVLGQANAPTGNTIGVWGETFSPTNGARGVMGFAQGTAGITYGVQGLTNSLSNGSAGVYGVSGFGDFPGVIFESVGVRGISKLGNAIHGVSQRQGVEGTLVDSAGNYQAAGILGFRHPDPPNPFYGVFSYGAIGSTAFASFVEPHPTDATKEITHAALEGPEAGTYFRGRGKFERGMAVISVPESFRLVSDSEGLSVQVTPVGEMATVAVVSLGLDGIVVKGSRDVEFFYTVNGVRKAFKDWETVRENRLYVPRGPEARMPGAFAPEQRRRLIATGIYNEDGTVNLETAERLGWAKAWRDREEQAKADAAAYRAAHEVTDGR